MWTVSVTSGVHTHYALLHALWILALECVHVHTSGHCINANDGFYDLFQYVREMYKHFCMDILYVPCMYVRNTFRKTLNINGLSLDTHTAYTYTLQTCNHHHHMQCKVYCICLQAAYTHTCITLIIIRWHFDECLLCKGNVISLYPAAVWQHWVHWWTVESIQDTCPECFACDTCSGCWLKADSVTLFAWLYNGLKCTCVDVISI